MQTEVKMEEEKLGYDLPPDWENVVIKEELDISDINHDLNMKKATEPTPVEDQYAPTCIIDVQICENIKQEIDSVNNIGEEMDENMQMLVCPDGVSFHRNFDCFSSENSSVIEVKIENELFEQDRDESEKSENFRSVSPVSKPNLKPRKEKVKTKKHKNSKEQKTGNSEDLSTCTDATGNGAYSVPSAVSDGVEINVKLPENAKSTHPRAFVCTECGNAYTKKNHLQNHFKSQHTNEKPFECEQCGKSFSLKDKYKTHLRRIHLGIKPYLCEGCGKAFSSKEALVVHLRTHTGEKPYKCDKCDKSFIDKTRLTVHSRTLHSKQVFPCEICKKSFTSKNYFRIHMRTIHDGVKAYNCDICNRSFTQHYGLKSHLRTHSGERPYSCDHCEKTFSQRCSLVVHMRSHTGERPYKCKECGKAFNINQHLQTHISGVHNGEKPFACEVCKKSFNRKQALNIHSRIHSAEKTD